MYKGQPSCQGHGTLQNVYSLQADVLREMARRLLSQESLPSLADDIDLDLVDYLI